MSFHEELNQKLNVFFNRDWFVELSEQEEEKMEELAAGLVKDFGWDTVFHAAFKYLKENCRTPESVMNFAHLYWESWWWNYPIEEPTGLWDTSITGLVWMWKNMIRIRTYWTAFRAVY